MAPTKRGARKGAARTRKAAGPFRYADLPEMEWIAIARDEIVAHAPTLRELDTIVEARDDKSTVVFSRVFPRGPGVW